VAGSIASVVGSITSVVGAVTSVRFGGLLSIRLGRGLAVRFVARMLET
jgi:hypothetical protein